MASDDFEEVPIQPAPAGIGHNNPPPDAPPTAQAALAHLDATLTKTTEAIDKRLDEFDVALERTPKVIESAEQSSKVVDFISMVDAGDKKIEALFEEAKAPWRDGGKKVDAHFNARRARVAALRLSLLGLTRAWTAKLRAEAEAKARAEAEKKRAEEAERQRLEAERQRQEAEKRAAEAAAARKAAEAKAEAGRMEEAIKQAEEAEKKAKAAAEQQAAAAAQAEQARLAAAAPVVVAPVTVAPLTGALGGTVSSTKRWTFEVIDKAKLPLEYLEPNESLIRAKMNAETKAKRIKDGEINETAIPGVRIYQGDSQRARG